MFSLERRRPVRSSLAGVVVVAIVFSCTAQTSRVAGAIQGSVVDQTGGAIAGAKVTLRNQSTNQTRTISTNAEGFFRARTLALFHALTSSAIAAPTASAWSAACGAYHGACPWGDP